MIHMIFSLPVLAFALLTSDPAFAYQNDPTEVPSPVDKIFVPEGFDDNDNVQVILHGEYPNTCFRTGDTKATVDEETRTIRVSATSYRYDAGCATVMTPFIQVVRVGVLSQGDYKVEYGADPAVSRRFSVKPRTSDSADEHLYAPVQNAHVSVDRETGEQTLHLRGTYPHMFVGCAQVKEIVIKIAPEDVVVVRPIMETHQDEGECGPDYTHKFSVSKVMPERFYGVGLLHVRVLNGNSLNRLIGIRR